MFRIIRLRKNFITCGLNFIEPRRDPSRAPAMTKIRMGIAK